MIFFQLKCFLFLQIINHVVLNYHENTAFTPGHERKVAIPTVLGVTRETLSFTKTQL